jgi:hypothetical protein
MCGSTGLFSRKTTHTQRAADDHGRQDSRTGTRIVSRGSALTESFKAATRQDDTCTRDPFISAYILGHIVVSSSGR